MLKTFSKVVTQFDGTPWKTEDGKADLTVAHAVVTALGLAFNDEQALNGMEKSKRFFLAERIYSAGATPVEVTLEDGVLIKALVAKAYPPFIVGWLWRYLESAEPAT